MNCKNCNEVVDGNFCKHCGQKTNIYKITLSNLLGEISESIFQLNRGFLFTLKELFIKPSVVIANFLEGKRKNYSKPITFLLTTSTFYFLVSLVMGKGTFVDTLFNGYNQGIDEVGGRVDEIIFFNWFSKNFAYTNLLLIPMFSLGSYVGFVRYKRNYLEHIVLNSYITGIQSFFYAFFMIVGVVIKNDDIGDSMAILLSVGYTIWVFFSFFKDGNRGLNIASTLLAYMIYMVLISVFLFIMLTLSFFFKG